MSTRKSILPQAGLGLEEQCEEVELWPQQGLPSPIWDHGGRGFQVGAAATEETTGNRDGGREIPLLFPPLTLQSWVSTCHWPNYLEVEGGDLESWQEQERSRKCLNTAHTLPCLPCSILSPSSHGFVTIVNRLFFLLSASRWLIIWKEMIYWSHNYMTFSDSIIFFLLILIFLIQCLGLQKLTVFISFNIYMTCFIFLSNHIC